jgi:hypothetical protein
MLSSPLLSWLLAIFLVTNHLYLSGYIPGPMGTLYCYYIPSVTYRSLRHVRSSPPIAKCLLEALIGTPQMVYTLRNGNQRLFTDYSVPCCSCREQRV